LFAAASVISLLLSVAMVVLWVRSYWRVTAVGVEWTRWLRAGTVWKQIGVGARVDSSFWLLNAESARSKPGDRYSRLAPSGVRFYFYGHFSPAGTTMFIARPRFLGFAYVKITGPFNYHPRQVSGTYIAVPSWACTSLTLIVPLVWARNQYRRHKESRIGRCRRCGYSLTGNTSGICPECGTPTAARRETTT
jgi:hypothetical protein